MPVVLYIVEVNIFKKVQNTVFHGHKSNESSAEEDLSVDSDIEVDDGVDQEERESFMPTVKNSAAKKGLKMVAISGLVAILVYQMFLKDVVFGKKTINEPKETKKIIKRKERDIDLDRKPTGRIAPKEDLSQLDQIKVTEVQEDDLEYREATLEDPNMPPLPDMSYEPETKTEALNQETTAEAKIDVPDLTSEGENVKMALPDIMDTSDAMPNTASLDKEEIDSENLDIEERRNRAIFLHKGDLRRVSKRKRSPYDKGKKKIFIYDGSGMPIEQKNEKGYDGISRIDHLNETLLQGKMLDAVLETSINSEVDGPVKGIVAKNVYGEMKDRILIPYGSRLYGSYSTTSSKSQSRVMIAWNRIIRPDGVSIAIKADAVDQFGQVGIEGDVDNRFMTALSKSLLFSLTTVGAAAALQKMGLATDQSQVVYPNGALTTTNINPVNVAAQSAIKTVSDIANKIVGDTAEVKPVLHVPHGTKVKVVVNQDMRIPPFRG